VFGKNVLLVVSFSSFRFFARLKGLKVKQTIGRSFVVVLVLFFGIVFVVGDAVRVGDDIV
jgi:hypothetical protein